MKAFDIIHFVNGKKQIVTMQADSEIFLDLTGLDVCQVIDLGYVVEWDDDFIPTDDDLFYIWQNAEKVEEEQRSNGDEYWHRS